MMQPPNVALYKLLLVIPLNNKGEICLENIKISANNQFSKFIEEINIFLTQFHFSKNFKIKEILKFEVALKKNFLENL